MRKFLSLLFACALCCAAAAQATDRSKLFNGLTGLQVYAAQNAVLTEPAADTPRVVFIGNSITRGWAHVHPEFFTSNGYAGRGIGGQVAAQMLLRFQADVVALSPAAVVINGGTNDIAGNAGPYDPRFTMDCIRSMVQIARANGIAPILSSVLPAGGFGWNQKVTDVPRKIKELNEMIRSWAASQSLAYIDYHTALTNADGALDERYAKDGVHPTAEAYTVMEGVAKAVIESVLSNH
jgi:lysophospholipase L1-like esterase